MTTCNIDMLIWFLKTICIQQFFIFHYRANVIYLTNVTTLKLNAVLANPGKDTGL